MSHAEIWDDSALVDSWNDALQEYKQYHSISARGEKVEDVLKATECHRHEIGGAMDYEGREVTNAPTKESLSKSTSDPNNRSNGEDPRDEQKVTVDSSATGVTGPTIPQHLTGQVHDESLKNLLMAWYYAGYYTGLHEGRQEVSASDKPMSK